LNGNDAVLKFKKYESYISSFTKISLIQNSHS